MGKTATNLLHKFFFAPTLVAHPNCELYVSVYAGRETKVQNKEGSFWEDVAPINRVPKLQCAEEKFGTRGGLQLAKETGVKK